MSTICRPKGSSGKMGVWFALVLVVPHGLLMARLALEGVEYLMKINILPLRECKWYPPNLQPTIQSKSFQHLFLLPKLQMKYIAINGSPFEVNRYDTPLIVKSTYE